jgi:hypothetical protein
MLEMKRMVGSQSRTTITAAVKKTPWLTNCETASAKRSKRLTG